MNLLGLAAVLSGNFSSAQEIVFHVDFGTADSPVYSGKAAAPFAAEGHTWNKVTGKEVVKLVDSKGSDAAGVGVKCVGPPNFAHKPKSPNLGGADDLMSDYRWAGNNKSLRLEISGLKPDKQFEIYLYAVGDAPKRGTEFLKPANPRGTTFQPELFPLEGETGNEKNPRTTGDGQSGTELVEGVHYVVLKGKVGKAGIISIEQRNNGSSKFAHLNGFQLKVSE